MEKWLKFIQPDLSSLQCFSYDARISPKTISLAVMASTGYWWFYNVLNNSAADKTTFSNVGAFSEVLPELIIYSLGLTLLTGLRGSIMLP